MRHCIFFIELNGFFEADYRLLHLVLHHEDCPFVSVELAIVWVDFYGFVIVCNSLF